MNGQLIGDQPIEIELAAKITQELLPALRNLLGEMTALQIAWRDNDMQSLIEGAAAADGVLAGFPVEAWQAWGTAFSEMQAWLEAENLQLNGMSPRQVLMRRYYVRMP